MAQRGDGRKRPQTGKRMKRRGGWYPVISFAVIVAAVIFAMSVFFKVSNITVAGNASYTEAEIIEASGIEQGDNLFFINRISAASRVLAKLPYIESATIDRALPNRVTITVSESMTLAYIPLEGDNWTVDRSCKLLGRADASEIGGLIRVDGIELNAPATGEIAAAVSEDNAKLTYLCEILNQIQIRNMQDYITYIDMATISNPTFDYLGRFTVKLGSYENVEYKFGLLETAVTGLEPGDYGTIDLSVDKQAHFSAN